MMPFIFMKDDFCQISGRKLHRGDHVVVFPPFKCARQSPEFVYSDGIALRDEFEKWELKTTVTKLVQDFWIDTYRDNKYFPILFEDDYYLIVKSLAERGRVDMFFLKHVLHFSFWANSWPQFCEQMVSLENGVVRLSDISILEWKIEYPQVTIEIKYDKIYDDQIIIPVEEWAHLQLRVRQGFE